MNSTRLSSLTSHYPRLRIGIAGDFCLDRYFEIDPDRQETSIETGLPVHNVGNVRCQPGGAGTILNNLAALGIGEIHAVGFRGDDGEGFELSRALKARPGVNLDHFLNTTERRTFTYSKPLVMHSGKAPEELSRLDIKNWTPTPEAISRRLAQSLLELSSRLDALILMDQVDVPGTGVITDEVLAAVARIQREHPKLLIVADSRRGLSGFPPVTFKMNRAELAALVGTEANSIEEIKVLTLALAQRQNQLIFVTLAEEGMIGAAPDGMLEHVPAFPVRGEIDIVGAGDAVTANLTASLAAGANVREALEIANAAASIVIHQLGTTGTASVGQIAALLGTSRADT
jgi:rfaE bifunctional protein kinase chain/domain